MNLSNSPLSVHQEYSKYWVEINYAAAAYDELNMCKSRLKSVDPEAIKNEPDAKSIMNIPYYEVDMKIFEHRAQLIEAERLFHRSQGTLKYLKHLENNSAEPEVCPICKQIPENKVSFTAKQRFYNNIEILFVLPDRLLVLRSYMWPSNVHGVPGANERDVQSLLRLLFVSTKTNIRRVSEARVILISAIVNFQIDFLG